MSYTYTRDIPVEENIDVLVAGGGPAGYSAAISAARLGAKVVLVELSGCLGGLATNGLVTRLDTTSDGRRMVVGGVIREVIETLYARGYISPYYSMERFQTKRGMYSPFDAEGMKLVLDELCESAGVDVRFFTKVIDVSKAADTRVDGVVVSDVQGLHLLRAKCFVDATGDGVLSALAGAAYQQAGTAETPRIMPPTMCSAFSCIPWETIELADKDPIGHRAGLLKALEDGFFSQPDKMIPGIARNCADTGGMNAGHIFGMDALNAKALSDGMRTGRRQVQEYAAYYRKYVPGFENMHLVQTAPFMGVRESRRILGEAVLTYADYAARRQFPDQIGIYCKTLDAHPYDLSKEEFERFLREAEGLDRLADGECYGLPYGMIVPKGFENLWVAGRCASSDQKMNSAVRVQPASAVMGQAAGTAACLCAADGSPAFAPDMEKLLHTLRSAGAVLE